MILTNIVTSFMTVTKMKDIQNNHNSNTAIRI